MLIGIDVVDVERFRNADLCRGAFYTYVFTAVEREAYQRDAARLASCFASKEAVAKAVASVLSPSVPPLDLCRYVQVLRGQDGPADVSMTSHWADACTRSGVRRIAVRAAGDRMVIAAAAAATSAADCDQIDAIASTTLIEALRSAAAVQARRHRKAQ